MAAAFLMAGLLLLGMTLTFNMGRDISLLVVFPVVFGYLFVRWHEERERRA